MKSKKIKRLKPKITSKNFDILSWIKNNMILTSLIVISLLCLVVGTMAVGFLISFVLTALADFIVYMVLIRKKKGKKKKKLSVWKVVLLLFFSFGILMIFAVASFFVWIAMNAEDFDPEAMYQQDATVIYDSNGEIIAKLGLEKRENISYDELPEVLINAVVATEDSRFFQHNGFDLPRFIKATLGQLLGNSDAGGASTLTMQLSKNIYTSTNDSGIQGIIRKFTDIYMSIFKIEKQYTKQEILEFYMNYNYLGGESRGGAYGVEQASLIYFGKNAKELNLSEAALIAGLFNSPNALDPLKHPEEAEARRNVVLYLMELHGYITHEERAIAESISVTDLLTDDYETSSYQGFIDTVVAEVQEKTGYDPYTVSMEIYSTMDKSKQSHVDGVMNGDYTKWANSAVQAGIAVIDTKTGAILAVGANRNLDSKKSYNYATMITKQIGSTAKPLYDYGPAIEYNNYSTYTLYADEPTNYTNGPAVNNWDGKFQNLITMRVALMGSRNIPALKTFKAVSNADIKEFVTNLGLSPEIEGGVIHEAHAIGGYNGESPLTLAAAYAAFGNGGIYNETYSFTKIVLSTGEEYENKTISTNAMGEDTAYMITSMLIDTGPVAIGYYNAKIKNATIAIKTGTTNYPEEIFNLYPSLPRDTINDLWVVGYDPDVTMAVWYGYDKINQEYIDNGYYSSLSRISNPHGNLFRDLGVGIFTDSDRFTQPSNVISVTIEKESNPAQLPSEFTPSSMKITELFKQGTEPTEISNRYSKLSDVTNLDYEVNNKVVSLSWTAIETPDAIDEAKIHEYVDSLYSDAGYNAAYFATRLKYNKDNIGTINYIIYTKDGDTLTEVGRTSDTDFEYTLTGKIPESIKFVVKTAYTIFTANMSNGSSVVADLSDVDVITIEFNGNVSKLEFNVDDDYTNPSPIVVKENGLDVTDEATISKVVKDSDNNVVTQIKTDEENTYTINYNVTYKDTSKSLTQTIEIKST
ncbi:MAG: transglycosylase domain-containing protein [Bacilli bacterium]|nr:transglycosylase domain-containing protein [Bacilli bacterium]